MDPTANLTEQLRLATAISEFEIDVNEDAYSKARMADRLSELVLALNEWISKGGALPAQWTKARK